MQNTGCVCVGVSSAHIVLPSAPFSEHRVLEKLNITASLETVLYHLPRFFNGSGVQILEQWTVFLALGLASAGVDSGAGSALPHRPSAHC